MVDGSKIKGVAKQCIAEMRTPIVSNRRRGRHTERQTLAFSATGICKDELSKGPDDQDFEHTEAPATKFPM
jgi:hypothetical protein